jgi:DNA-directed RNA polymerase alpha subunit
LNEGGIATAGDFVSALEEGGDDALLAIKGFGRKGLADVKRRLKELGYALPETAG